MRLPRHIVRTKLQTIVVALALVLSLVATPAVSQEAPPDPNLAAGVEALQAGNHEAALRLLKRASRSSDDPRIVYYEAYALEKLGKCQQAHDRYLDAVAKGPEQYTASAIKALRGFYDRCAVEPHAAAAQRDAVVKMVEPNKPRSRTLATVGWVLASIGALTFAGLPVKLAFEREVASRSETYLETVYMCDVDKGEIGQDCDEEAVRSNEQWNPYVRRIEAGKRSSYIMVATATALVVGGIASIAIGSSRASVSAAPTNDGATMSLSFRF